MKEKIKTQWIKIKKYLIKKLGGVHPSDISVKKEIAYVSSEVKPITIHGVYKADPHVYAESANYRKSVMENLRKELISSMEEMDGVMQVEVSDETDIFTGKLAVRASIIVLPFCEVRR